RASLQREARLRERSWIDNLCFYLFTRRITLTLRVFPFLVIVLLYYRSSKIYSLKRCLLGYHLLEILNTILILCLEWSFQIGPPTKVIPNRQRNSIGKWRSSWSKDTSGRA